MSTQQNALSYIAVVILSCAMSTPAAAQTGRDYVYVVGSSTVYPFATVVAERFGRSSEFKTPKIESTGSGGGLKLFCDGVGVDYPDVTNASRAIKQSEVDFYLMPGEVEYLSSDSLRYCLSCMTKGFHSPIHQLLFIEFCPFHGTPLNDGCPACGKSINTTRAPTFFAA